LISAGIPVDTLFKYAGEDMFPRTDVIALLVACMSECEQVGLTLVRRAANVNAKAAEGSTPLVRALLEKDVNVEDQDMFGSGTALIKAAMVGNVDIVQALVAGGAELNARDERGRTALMEAAKAYAGTLQKSWRGLYVFC
jgi:ankyrin repeat protein